MDLAWNSLEEIYCQAESITDPSISPIVVKECDIPDMAGVRHLRS